MTLKGKTFTRADIRRKGMSDEKKDIEAAALTERYRIVARDGEHQVIAEELQERSLRRLGEEARPAATNLLHLSPAARQAVLRAFDAAGDLVNTLDPA